MSYMSWRQAEQVPLRPRQHGGFETCLIAKLVVSMVLYHLDKCVLKLMLLLRPLCMLHNPTVDFLSFFSSSCCAISWNGNQETECCCILFFSYVSY